MSLDVHPDTLSEFAAKHFRGHSRSLKNGHSVHTDLTLDDGSVLMRATTYCLNGRALTMLHGIHEQVVK